MHHEPAALDGEFEARAVLGRAAAVTEEKRLVDFLDMDAALESARPRATIRIASSGNGRCSALEPSVTVIEERERHQIVERFASRLEPLATRAAGA